MNNILTFKKVNNQPFEWIQAIKDAEERGLTAKNILLYPILQHSNKFKNHESILFDYLVLGDNLFVALLLIEKILQKPFHEESLNIGIFITNTTDYWPYMMLEHESFFHVINEKYKTKIYTTQDFLKFILRNKHPNINITLIQHENTSVSEIKFDTYVKGYITHITPTTDLHKNPLFFIKNLESTSEALNHTKQLFTKDLLHFLDKKITISNKKPKFQNCIDRAEDSYILLSKHLLLTSMPNNLLSVNNNDLINEKFIQFEHQFTAQSFGSAAHIPKTFDYMFDLFIEEIIKIQSVSLI